MTGLILLNGYSDNPNIRYKIRRLKEEFLPFGATLDVKTALEMPVLTSGEKNLTPYLEDYSFCIDMDKDRYLAKAISEKMPLINSYKSMMLSDDKMLTLLALSKSGVKAPLTIAAPLCYTSKPDPKKVEEFLNQVEKRLSYPLVYKECHGSLGMQVALIHNRKELEARYLSNIQIPHFYERFLQKNAGHDYRVIVIDGKVLAAMERINEKDFRSNIALGGKGKDVTNTLPDAFKDMALKATKALELDYAGIDIGIDDDGSPCFYEANGNAFFTEIEEVTNINIAKPFAEMVMKKINNLN